MPYVSPEVRFILGIIFSVAGAIAGGTLVLKGAIPEAWIPVVVAWSSIIGFVGNVVLTALNAMAATPSSKIQSAANLPDVKQIVTTAQIANSETFAPNDKVIAK